MKIFDLVKSKKSIRKYKKKDIDKKKLDKILDAGTWGPSVLGRQTWRFLLVKKNDAKNKISGILVNKADRASIGVRILLKAAAVNIKNAPAAVLVYNCRLIQNLSHRLGKEYLKLAEMAEVASTAGAIQNLTLVAADLGIGACWHDIPLICEKEINKLFNEKNQLIAIVTLGYPDEEGLRSPRKEFHDFIRKVD